MKFTAALMIALTAIALTVIPLSSMAKPQTPLQVLAPDKSIQQVRSIDIEVQPYYRSAAHTGGKIWVAVETRYNEILTSTNKPDILTARDDVLANPDYVSPMAMMVLAIRLYDMGERDEAVFWFYVAKGRYSTLMKVIDTDASGLQEDHLAMMAFAQLAGPVINSYAFCDFEKQQQATSAAIKWVEDHPYKALFIEKLIALPGDRLENLGRGIITMKASIERENQTMRDPEKIAWSKQERKKNNVDEQYCWVK